jgi:DNA polymerase-4
LDVTTPLAGPAPAVTIARSIKAAIRETTGLTASAGVSFNKFLAKIASDLHKPDGLTVIRPEQALAFLADLPIERFHGVGPATARRMRGLGIASGADLQGRSEHALTAAFGRLGHHYWRMARAEDDRAVEPNRPRLSVSVETTFENDMRSDSELEAALLPLARELALRVERMGFQGRTLNLKVRFSSFRIATKRMTRTTAFREPDDILHHARELLAQRPRGEAGVRLLGIGVSSEATTGDSRQLALQLTEMDGGQR